MTGHDRSPSAGLQPSAHRTETSTRFHRQLLLALITMILCGTQASTAGETTWAPPPPPPDGDTDGRAIVSKAVDFMEVHEELAFEALVTYEALQDDGQKLQFDMKQRVAIRRPGQLFWTTLFDDGSVHWAWCDRGEFTLLKQPANVWGRVKVPPTLKAAVARIDEEYAVDVPFVDILGGDPAELWLGEDVEDVDYIGPAWIGGHWTDHVAIRKPGVDIELWFRRGDEPFPMKFALVFTEEKHLPGHTVRFGGWSTRLADLAIPKFEPPTDSERVEVVPVIGN